MPDPDPPAGVDALLDSGMALYTVALTRYRKAQADAGPAAEREVFLAGTEAALASTAARLAHALIGRAHVELAREAEQRAREFHASLAAAAEEPLTDNEYQRSLEGWRDQTVAVLGHAVIETPGSLRQDIAHLVETAPRR